jgi:hypothetical protein
LATPVVTIIGNASVCLNAAAPVIVFTNPMALPVVFNYKINGGPNTPVNLAANSTLTLAVPTDVAGTFIYSLVNVSYQSNPTCLRTIAGSATVTVNPIPTCSINGPLTVFAGSPGNTYTTTVSPSGGTVTYAWTISGNGTISGPANGQSVSVTAGTPGTYTLTVQSHGMDVRPCARSQSPQFCQRQLLAALPLFVPELRQHFQ